MNDIIVMNPDETIERNQKAIVNYNGRSVFPINKALQKELKRLKEEKIGDLKTQVSFIRKEKETIYAQNREKEMKEIQKNVEKENAKLQKNLKRIMGEKRKKEQLIDEIENKTKQVYERQAIDFYKNLDEFHKKYPGLIEEFSSYGFPLKQFRGKQEEVKTIPKVVKDYEAYKREEEDMNAFKITFSQKGFEAQVKKDFEEKYGAPFKMLTEKIAKLETQFDEALLFADVAVVRDVYYNMKQADKFLDTLRTIEVQ
jgi:hypothetical protein